MSKKEETHAKRRINALHISILVQPDDYRWLENSGENLHILVKDSEWVIPYRKFSEAEIEARILHREDCK
jgi:hypothetical protein